MFENINNYSYGIIFIIALAICFIVWIVSTIKNHKEDKKMDFTDTYDNVKGNEK